jgi:hypothetical protein
MLSGVRLPADAQLRNLMTTRQVIEAVLMTVAALLGAAGAIVIEPMVIGAGAVAAAAALILRMTDADRRKEGA